MWLAFPDDPETPALCWQFVLGPLVVAPVLEPGTTQVEVYLPAGRWQHLWSGSVVDAGDGRRLTVDAPSGEPAVFFPEGDPEGEALWEALRRGDLQVAKM